MHKPTFRGPPGNDRGHAKALLAGLAAVVVVFAAANSAQSNDRVTPIILAVVGTAAAVYLIALGHRRLRARGKNIWWLLLFFGPLAIGIGIFDQLPADNDKIMAVSLIAICFLCAPFAIWGVVELTRASRSTDD